MSRGRRFAEDETSAVYYTTHQVARFLQVSVPTVVNWIDDNRLKAHRTPGGHRRIAQSEIVAFAEEHGFPLPREFWRKATANPRIVIVDDDAQFADTVRDYLTAKGQYEINVARTPFEAGYFIGRRRPDVVICDPRMARLEGLEVAAWLRARTEQRDVVLVACTISNAPDTERYAEVFDEVLEKPFRLQALLEVIRRRLDND